MFSLPIGGGGVGKLHWEYNDPIDLERKHKWKITKDNFKKYQISQMISLFEMPPVYKLTTSGNCINSYVTTTVFITNTQLLDVWYSLGS